MAKRQKRRIGVAIDMTPMVDIGFLLLIFYMTTTQFKPPEKQQVTLPQSESQYKIPQKDIINITVNKKDQIFLEYITTLAPQHDTIVDGRPMHRGDTTIVRDYTDVEPTTINTEFLKVQQKFLSKKVNPLVIVKADRDARYGTVKKVMDTLQDIKINHFSLETERSQPTSKTGASAG
jgi:biopolymer transport protein ExbD